MVLRVLFVLYRMGLFGIGVLLFLSYVKNVFMASLWGVFVDEVYDYIIVGGGTAGAVVAGRLARDQGMSVLVLEAGGPPPTWEVLGLADVPLMAPMWQRTYMDWSFVTSPQYDACQGLQDSVSRWPRGRVLGGTARLNNLLYLRGNSLDWEEWEKAGAVGWGPKSMLRYFLKSERQLGAYVNDSDYHKRTGWLPLSDSPLTGLGKAVLEGVDELGMPVQDLNGAQQNGFMRAQITTSHGARFSPDKVFFQGDMTGLDVLTNSRVDKVLVNDRLEAYGVQFQQNGNKYEAKSRHGVVLSAGVIGTPQILMLSGIGPKNLLQSLNIPLHVDLPVGQNLQDHLITGLDLVLLNTTLALNLASALNLKSALSYALEGRGPWTHGGAEVVGVWRSNRVNITDPPDLHMMVLPAGVASDGGALLRHNFGISDKVWGGYFEPLARRDDIVSVTLGVSLLHPKSRGEVSIQSSNPDDPPLIDPNYLSDPDDVDTLVAGIDFIKRLTRTKAMSQLGATVNPRKVTGCKPLPFFSRRYWQCYIRSLSVTSYHPVGTCRMGNPKNPDTVVDPKLRVVGVSKLYVADASVMPTTPSANPMAAVIAIAEKMADILQTERESDELRLSYSATQEPLEKNLHDPDQTYPEECHSGPDKYCPGRSDEL